MKTCPFCKEQIQDGAIKCKHCGSNLTSPTPQPQPSTVPVASLVAFERFMASYGKGWVLVNKSNAILNYQKVIPAQNGSCLIAVILLFLFVIPAILYMIYGRSPARTYSLTVSADSTGTLTPSGDKEGMRVYKAFLDSLAKV